jgi:hypothetical protein
MIQVTREIWLLNRLFRAHSVMVDRGDTTFEVRKGRAREAILRLRLQDCAVNARDGKQVTYAEIFALVYGEPLIANQPHGLAA